MGKEIFVAPLLRGCNRSLSKRFARRINWNIK